MSAIPPTEISWTAAALRAWLEGKAPEPLRAELPPRLAPFLEEQRMDVLASDWGIPSVGSSTEYARRALFHQRVLAEGCQLLKALRDDGIPALALRGPFAAATLYPDPADRPFRDLDILVPREQARAALQIFIAHGFRLEQPFMPRSYFLRNHLHWMLLRDRDGIVCDLHWAVEHRFRPYQIDVQALFSEARPVVWRGHSWVEPSPEHAFLLSALHARKHLPTPFDPHDVNALLFAPGCLFQWLDVARIALRSIHAEPVCDLASRWNIAPVVGLASRVLREALGIHLSESIVAMEGQMEPAAPAIPAWVPQSSLAHIGRLACFRSSKLSDAFEYIARPHPSGNAFLSGFRRVGATLRVGVAAADTLLCSAGAWCNRRFRSNPSRSRAQ